MVRRAKWPVTHQAVIALKRAGDGMDLRRFQRLFGRHPGQDGGEAFGKHALSASGRADQKEIMVPRRGDLEAPFDERLSFHVAEINIG